MATQYGTIKIETSSGKKELPVFKVGDSGASIYESLRVRTSSGTGFIPLIDPADATFDEVRVHTSSHGTLAVHDSAASIQVTTTSTTNGENVTLTVYEDTTGDGTVDNEESFSLSGGTENLSPGSLSLATGNTLWYHLEAEDSDVTNAAEIDSVKLVGESNSLEWTARDDFSQGQSSSGMTYDSMGDHSKDKIQHGYKHGSVTEGLVAYYPMENSGSDVIRDGALNHPGEVNAATWSSSGKVGNDCLSFDGSSKVAISENGSTPEELRLQEGDHTVLMWAKSDVSLGSSDNRHLFKSGADYRYGLWADGDQIRAHVNDSSGGTYYTHSWSQDTNWHLIGQIYENGEVKVVLDGEIYTGSQTSFSQSNTDYGLFIGGINSGGQWNGLIDDVRLYNRAISRAETQAIYNRTDPNGREVTSSDVPGNTDGGISRYEFENDATDSWGSNDGSDNTSVGYVNGVYGQAKDFDGSDDYVDTSYAANFGSQAFSASSWVKFNSSGSYETIVGTYDGSTGWLHRKDNSGNYQLWLDGSNVTGGNVTFSDWNHFVSVRDTAGNVYLYVNGKLVKKGTLTGNADSSSNMEIGRYPNNGNYLNGSIDDVRIYGRALKPEEVENLFHLGAHRIDRSNTI